MLTFDIVVLILLTTVVSATRLPALAFTELLTVTRFVLRPETLVLTFDIVVLILLTTLASATTVPALVFTELLTVTRFVLIPETFVLIFVTLVLTSLSRLLTIETPPTFVKPPPSPINFPNTVPAEIVEKNPKVVEIEYVEILLAVNKPVLSNVVLRTGGIIAIPPVAPTIPVRPDPSP